MGGKGRVDRRHPRTRTALLAAGVLMSTLGATACLGSGGGYTSQNATSSTIRTPSSPTAAGRQAAALATTACRMYESTVEANNAHPNDAVAFPNYFVATGQAEEAAKLDPQSQGNLAVAFDQVKADIAQINTVQAQAAQPGQRPSASASATLNQDRGLLTGHLDGVNALCTPLTGSSHPANLTTG